MLVVWKLESLGKESKFWFELSEFSKTGSSRKRDSTVLRQFIPIMIITNFLLIKSILCQPKNFRNDHVSPFSVITYDQ